MGTKFRILMAGIACGPLAISAAMAQAPGGTAEHGGAVTGVEDIVVTARRVAESAQSVPLAITTFGEVQIRERQIRNIIDVQASTPSLFISQGTSGSATTVIAIRGQVQTDSVMTLDPSVGVYVDNVVWSRQYGLRASLVDIEQIEILKGPQGTLFGKNTTGGAMVIQTKKPDLVEAGGYFNVLTGNHEAVQFTGAVNVPLVADQLAIRIAGQYNERDGFGRSLFTGEKTQQEKNRTIRGHLRWEPSDSVRLLVSGDYSHIFGNGQNVRVTSVNPFPETVPGRETVVPAYITEILAERGLANTPANRLIARQLFVDAVTAGGYRDTNTNEDLKTDVEIYGVSADLSVDVGGITLRSITANRWLDRFDNMDYDASPFMITSPQTINVSKNFSEEFQIIGDGDRFDWIVGAYYNRETGDELNFATQAVAASPAGVPIRFLGEITNKSYAAFGQANYQITDTLRVTGGIRYTKEDKALVTSNNRGPAMSCLVPVALRDDGVTCKASFDDTFKKFTYTASVDWHPVREILLYARTSRGFRGGGQNYRGTNAIGFMPFEPEVATDYEIGFKADLWNRRLRINGAVYHTDYSNVQKSVLVRIDNIQSTLVQNAAKAKIDGVEIETTLVPVDGLTLRASGSYIDARYESFFDLNGDRSGESFPVPKYTFSVSGNYAFEVGQDQTVTLAAEYNWVDDTNYRPEAVYDEGVTQPAYGLLNGRISYRLDNDGLEFAAFIKNAANRKYYTAALNQDASQGFNIGFQGNPRLFGVEIRKTFGGG